MVDHERLHPRLGGLLKEFGWTGLTAPQEATLGPVLDGQHVLLVAPTGHGKTEAALLPVMGRLLSERDALAKRGLGWPKGFKAIYITPLRALNRDLLGRLQAWAEALDLTVGVRHGDTTQSERSRQARNPPDLLITTPETLQLLLYGDTLRRHLATVRFVVLDEVHDLAASERGAQLTVALERLEEAIGQPAQLRQTKAAERICPRKPDARPGGGFQRIGLSATVADATVVAAFLAGIDPATGEPRQVNILEVAADKKIELAVVQPEVHDDDHLIGGQLMTPPNAVAELRTARELATRHARVLVFQNTRDAAELMVSRSAILDSQVGAPTLLELHHGSLSSEVRADVEDRFKNGEVHALVATSSLELGIDVGAIDHVVQVHSPRSVTRLVQRLGRAGHRAGATSAGTLVTSGPEDILECMAVARAAMEGRLEPLRLRDEPLVVLANQLVALTNEYAELDPDWTRAVVSRAYPFRELDEGLFQATWDALLEAKTLYPSEQAARRFARSGRARKHFLSHIGMIADERTFRIFDEAAKRTIGSVDDSFVAASLHPGALFIMAGRPWQVLEIENEEQRVRVGPVAEIGAVPQWSGSDLPVSREVAREVAKLRRLIATGASLAAYPVEAAALAVAADPIGRHQDAGLQVPTDQLVTIEQSRRLVVINVPLGSRGNEALGRITQALLHQRLGAAVALETDAYRIHLTLPAGETRIDLEGLWDSLDPDTLDLLLAMILRDNPLTRHHLVQVAKQFGAVPDALDPNRFTKARMQSLLDQLALQEETLSRLVHDRLDVGAVQEFLRALRDGAISIVRQGLGPLSLLRQEETKNLFAAPKSDERLLQEVRRRIEDSDVLMACCSCGSSWSPGTARDLPRRIACRRCGSIQVACLRPWNEDQVRLLKGDGARLGADDRALRGRFIKNGAMVASFGRTACLAMVARGIGADGAARLLQKIQDPEDPRFWREVLQMELTFARTNAFWKR